VRGACIRRPRIGGSGEVPVPAVRNRALRAVGCAQRDIGPRLLSVLEGRMLAMGERVRLGAAGIVWAAAVAWAAFLNAPGEPGLDG
jgi:hypothetical protein